ncbi:MAG: sigma-70 family RNA polymerase sigma factor [Isosphaeraceae bacterium]
MVRRPSDGGDPEADGEAFVLATYAGLYRWFHRLTASPDQAADLTQETYAAFWRSARRRGPGVSQATWLYAIGRNLWRKRLRDRKPSGTGDLDRLPARDRPADRAAQDREFARAAADEVARLPADLREAFTLRFWGEFGFDQIGAIQGISPALARWRYFAARQRLHRALDAWNPDPDRGEIPEDPVLEPANLEPDEPPTTAIDAALRAIPDPPSPRACGPPAWRPSLSRGSREGGPGGFPRRPVGLRPPRW